ncbi:GNAT family N-acetyltransferase [Siculibacillus lacustris]|uniref:GNAT family N-acetyltransferase n=1 Tax=Siculibacillus lacustris TaxID=1549641 RepID=A0A4Q9VRZ8_9HYPH|nr:GNAT family N-acetyltransferase [Siculibacillus lacustris]TBW38724.1 GNAT family N-acetyltransferase [Siculibacillus lacustris]
MTPTSRPAAFAAETHDLGDLVLGPLGDDVDAIAAVLATLDPWARAGLPVEAMRRRLTRPMAATYRFALRLDGRPVGCVSLRHPFMRGPYVETIAVFPEAQRRGVARRVVEWMGREVAGEASNLWLCVTEWNTPARAAYRALGFVEIGPAPDLAVLGQTEIFMRKPLGPPIVG